MDIDGVLMLHNSFSTEIVKESSTHAAWMQGSMYLRFVTHAERHQVVLFGFSDFCGNMVHCLHIDNRAARCPSARFLATCEIDVGGFHMLRCSCAFFSATTARNRIFYPACCPHVVLMLLCYLVGDFDVTEEPPAHASVYHDDNYPPCDDLSVPSEDDVPVVDIE